MFKGIFEGGQMLALFEDELKIKENYRSSFPVSGSNFQPRCLPLIDEMASLDGVFKKKTEDSKSFPKEKAVFQRRLN